MLNAETQLLFVQGGGKGTHDEWDNKLVESLRRELGPGYEILYPRMPHARVHRLRGRDHQLNNDLSDVAAAIVALE